MLSHCYHDSFNSAQFRSSPRFCSVLPVQAEMERALLQGERQAELDQIEAETDIIAQLQHKLDELESVFQREKDKVKRSTWASDVVFS